MNKPLSKIEVGEYGVIDKFLDQAVAGKLLTMGVLPGSTIKVVRKAPFNGGLYLKINGYNMVLRQNEAASILLTTTD